MSPEEYRLYSEKQAAEQAAEARSKKTARTERSNAVKMQRVLDKLERTAGNTPYVFAGSSPSGWDCSGLVAWTYRQMGKTLPHGAIAQAKMGRFVNDPVPGDIVAYFYRGYPVSTHSGIYIGNGQVIHALKPGTVTRIESAERGVVSWSMVARYVRIIPLTNPPKRVERRGDLIPVSVVETAS
jgi:cell wall-associated NlpC family hydrolase